MTGPLADRLRPTTIDEVAGQQHLLGPGKVLRRIAESGKLPNLIFYGPSGVGKTTVANILAKQCGKKLYYLNATVCSTQDIKDIIHSLGGFDSAGGVLLYLDEIQYFNKKQQQILLSFIENGDITLIAATTENPYFYVYNAILSRSTVFEFKPLTAQDVETVLHRALGQINNESHTAYTFGEGVAHKLAQSAGGDVRRSLNMLELCLLLLENGTDTVIDQTLAEQVLSHNAVRYDREGDEHYDIVSAYQKAMRGSDPDAAVYYLARLLAAGDLPSACRRLMVCACEDVGLAYPGIIPIVKAAVDIAQSVGMPEAQIPLADAVILVATSPKSNTGNNAIAAALADVEAGLGGEIPRHLQNKHFDGAEAAVKGQHYLYPHDFPGHWVKQQYLPDGIRDKHYYRYGDNKTEQAFKAYMDKLKENG